MAMIDVNIDPLDEPLPDAITELITDARGRIDRFINDRRDTPIAAFVPCDFAAVYGYLAAIDLISAAPGELFCEWGAGFGVSTMMAATLGFDATGIEIESDLVDEAAQLADDHGIHANFAAGTFIPTGCDHLTDYAENTWIDMGGHDGYDALEIEPDEIDLAFVYPWPGEEDTMIRLFDRIAVSDSLLVIYRDIEGVRVMRKR